MQWNKEEYFEQILMRNIMQHEIESFTLMLRSSTYDAKALVIQISEA